MIKVRDFSYSLISYIEFHSAQRIYSGARRSRQGVENPLRSLEALQSAIGHRLHKTPGGRNLCLVTKESVPSQHWAICQSEQSQVGDFLVSPPNSFGGMWRSWAILATYVFKTKAPVSCLKSWACPIPHLLHFTRSPAWQHFLPGLQKLPALALSLTKLDTHWNALKGLTWKSLASEHWQTRVI